MAVIFALLETYNRGTQREYSTKPLKHSIVTRILVFKSDGQEISTIEWQELKNEFRLFSDYK